MGYKGTIGVEVWSWERKGGVGGSEEGVGLTGCNGVSGTGGVGPGI